MTDELEKCFSYNSKDVSFIDFILDNNSLLENGNFEYKENKEIVKYAFECAATEELNEFRSRLKDFIINILIVISTENNIKEDDICIISSKIYDIINDVNYFCNISKNLKKVFVEEDLYLYIENELNAMVVSSMISKYSINIIKDTLSNFDNITDKNKVLLLLYQYTRNNIIKEDIRRMI